MKRLSILLFSMVMAGEMTVDGNLIVADTLHVTTIKSATNVVFIDSLLSLIAQLEQRIAQLECHNTGIIPDGYCDCFFHTLDECGICNGDTTSCQDCAGVPNGDNLLDICGYCDNDSSNDCVQDCFGEWGGTAEYDACGMCGGVAISEDDCNYALEFTDAGYYIDIGLPSGMSPTGSHTIMFKVKNYTSPDETGTLIGADVGGSFSTNNSLHYVFRPSNNSDCPNGACMSMDFYNNPLLADTYLSSTLTHWALVYNADGSKERYIYRDGELVAQGCDGNHISNSDCDYSGDFELILGGISTSGGVNTNFNGVIDDFSVWSIPLSAEEVLNYYLSDPVGNEDNLEVLYNFNEGSGYTINDSANQNHGTIIGADPVWVERE